MSNSLSNTFVPAQYPFRLPDLQALVFWPGSAPATLIRIVIAGACLGAFAAPADAAPEPYSRVQLESSIASSPTAHTEIERLVEYAVTLDVPAETIEFGASEGIEAIRAFDLADASSDGASFLIQSETQTNGCEGDPPCPEPLSIANGYLTLADLSELYRPKGLLAPNAEFFVGVQAFEGRAQGEPSYVGFEALLAKPAALSSVDLLGTYLLATYSNQLGRDFVGGTSEIAGVSTVNITFNGDGSCSGSQIVNAGVLQRTDWPMLNSRSALEAEINGGESFPGCSYSVDADAGATTVVLEISDGGDTFLQPITLFVSSDRRYLAGRLVIDSAEGGEGGEGEAQSDLTLLMGLRLGTTAVSNANLAGTYFMSSMGEVFSGAEALGVDSDFVTRTVLTFEGGATDGEGFSACTIAGRTYAGSLRSLGGSVPSPTTSSVVFSGNDNQLINGCRYKAESATSATLELIAQGEVSRVTLAVSDDRQTLLGSRLITSGDPLDPNFVEELPIPSLALAELHVLQRFGGNLTDDAVADFAAPLVPAPDAGVQLAASVLPGSRSVQQGDTATAFASIINFGSEDGLGCDIRYGGSRSLIFNYQETLPNNAPTGGQNEGVDIAAGATQTFFFGVTPLEPFSSEELELNFSCLNSGSATPIVGLNTLLLSSTLSPGPDVVALGATVSGDGIARLSGGSGFFTLASVNVGAQDNMTVSVDTGAASLPLVVSLCQSDPNTSACVNPAVPSAAPVNLTIDAGDTPTFAVFLSASESIALDAANKRVFVRFRDSTGVVRGSTSVAVLTE